METKSIDILKDFTCLGSSCPDTCCKGWQILLDEETANNYKNIPGIYGKRLRSHIIFKEPVRIRKIMGKCPFHTMEGLCSHQQNGDMGLMPLVCVNYPRRAIDCGEYMEATLELSCPRAAEIFLENPGRRDFIHEDNPVIPLWQVENNDGPFLSFLKSEREKLLDFLWSDLPIYTVWESIFAYIYAQNDLLARDRLSQAKSIVLTTDKDKQGEHALYSGRGHAFFNIVTLDHMLLGHIDGSALVIRAPRLYWFLKKYNKIFRKKTVREADIFFDKKLKEMQEKQSHLALKYKSYFSYCLQQEYITAYESYSLIREVLFCILYCQLLMLLDLTEYLVKGSITKEREVEILYLLEHNVRHNPYLSKSLFNVIREEFLS